MELIYSETADSSTFIDAILYWKARYGLKDGFAIRTDNGSHFSNHVAEELAKCFRYKHNFSIAYSGWTNGSTEAANKRVLTLLKSMCSEYGFAASQWKMLIPLVQCAINHRMDPKTGFSPNQVFFGKEKDKENLIQCTHEDESYAVLHGSKLKYPKDPEEIKNSLQGIAEEVQAINKKMCTIRDRIREEARKSYEKRLKLTDVQFIVGEWVLISDGGKDIFPDKLRLTWRRPYYVEEQLGPNHYTVKNLLGESEVQHATRMKTR